MTDLRLRAADPARDIQPDPRSPEARQLLSSILAESPPASRRHSRHSPRLILGTALASAAAIAAVVIPLSWNRTTPNTAPAAFTVTPRPDGSVRFTVRWSELANPSQLQAALDEAHVPVRILIGTITSSAGTQPDITTIPACAKPYYGGPYDKRAVQWDFPSSQTEVNGVVVRPKYFPPHGTLVIEAYHDIGSTKISRLDSFMAIGAVPTCTVPLFTPPSGAPTH
jgi:hypothetical protein